ncbi:unnamed protein product [Parnassius apollo]|uniref:(apollo) hypothetical protein n=1 Tax=Parnassius apollo TaxID=110799 RepID=A0A8S3WQD3_PARAO|nr:unnamed protein product [Parnassius apollo]
MIDPSSKEARERLLAESLLKLWGEHNVTHQEPLLGSSDEARRVPDFSSSERYGPPPLHRSFAFIGVIMMGSMCATFTRSTQAL